LSTSSSAATVPTVDFVCEQEQSVMEEERKDFLINIRHIEHTHTYI